MSIAFVQAASYQVPSSTSALSAFVSSNAAGNCIIVCVGCWKSGGGTGTISIPTDTQGNSYRQIGASLVYLNGVTALFYAPNCKAGGNTVSVTVANSSDITLQIFEYSGASTTAPVESYVNNSGSVTAGGSLSSGNLTTVNANDVLFSFGYTYSNNMTLTPSSGYTQRENEGSTGETGTAWDKAEASTGTYSNTVTFSLLSNGSYVWLVALTPFTRTVHPVVCIIE